MVRKAFLWTLPALVLAVLAACTGASSDAKGSVSALSESSARGSSGDERGNLSLSFLLPALPGPAASRAIAAESASADLYLDELLYDNIDLSSAVKSERADGSRQYSCSVYVPMPFAGSYSSLGLVFLDSSGRELTRGEVANVTLSATGATAVNIGCIPCESVAVTEAGASFGSSAETLEANSTRFYSFSTAGQVSYDLAPSTAGATLRLYKSDGSLLEEDGGAGLRHTFVSAGDYYASAVASNALAGFRLLFTKVDLPPIVALTPIWKVTLGQETLISWTKATDPEGKSLSFAWSIDGSTVSTASSLTYTFAGSSVKSLELAVSDGMNTVTMKASIYNADEDVPPIASAGDDATVRIGDELSFDGSGSSDPDLDAISAYAWDFGDGSTSDLAAPTHSYAAAGEYSATLRVTANGLTSPADERIVTVTENHSPLSSLDYVQSDYAWTNVNGTFACRNHAIAFDASESYDLDVQDRLSYAWDFGDGTTGSGAAVTHSYGAYGSYYVKLVVSDDRAASSSSLMLLSVGPMVPFRIQAAEGTTIDASRWIGIFVFYLDTGEILRFSGGAYPEADETEVAGNFIIRPPALDSFDATRPCGLVLYHKSASANGVNTAAMKFISEFLREKGANFAGLMYLGSEFNGTAVSGNVIYDATGLSTDAAKAALLTPANTAVVFNDGDVDWATVPVLVFEDQSGNLDVGVW